MTEYIIRTTKEEADEIFCGAKSFVFRTSKIKYYLSDRIKFQVQLWNQGIVGEQ